MSNFTPGPWEVNRDGDTVAVQTGEKTRSMVAYVTGIKVHPETTKANARLIAAAPELLEAVRNLFYHARCMWACKKTPGLGPDETWKAYEDMKTAEALLRRIDGEEETK